MYYVRYLLLNGEASLERSENFIKWHVFRWADGVSALNGGDILPCMVLSASVLHFVSAALIHRREVYARQSRELVQK